VPESEVRKCASALSALAAFVTMASVHLTLKQYSKLCGLMVGELMIVNCKRSDHLDDKSVHGDPEVRLGLLRVLRSLILVPQFPESRPLQPSIVLFGDIAKWEQNLTIKLFAADCVNIVNCIVYPVVPVQYVESAVILSNDTEYADDVDVDEVVEEETMVPAKVDDILIVESEVDSSTLVNEVITKSPDKVISISGVTGSPEDPIDVSEEPITVAMNGINGGNYKGTEVQEVIDETKSAAPLQDILDVQPVSPTKNTRMKNCSVVLDFLDLSSDESVRIQSQEMPALRRSARKRTAVQRSGSQDSSQENSKPKVSRIKPDLLAEVNEETDPDLAEMLKDFKP